MIGGSGSYDIGISYEHIFGNNYSIEFSLDTPVILYGGATKSYVITDESLYEKVYYLK